jgi:alpha-methylacyl-CoA racemase
VAGPLAGLKIVELAGLGPAPFAGMMLADHGADVIRVERPGARINHRNILARSRRSVTVDLKKPGGADLVRDICKTADGLIEGFRPGVMERLGLGPEALLADNPRLVYGRMTGWGQSGPYAKAAGHDINYIAIAGVLHAIGRVGGKPVVPLNLIGDFGGGGMVLAFGMVSAILHARQTGVGQVIDCAMIDGAALLMSAIWSTVAEGTWQDERGVNVLDSGAHFYEVYETSDGRYLAVGAIEPPFYAALREAVGVADDPAFDAQRERSGWPSLKMKLATIFKMKSRDEWSEIMKRYDACCTPVLSIAEAPGDPQNAARGTFLNIDGVIQPAAAPRYSKTTIEPPAPATPAGAAIERVLVALGYDPDRVASLVRDGVIPALEPTASESNTLRTRPALP